MSGGASTRHSASHSQEGAQAAAPFFGGAEAADGNLGDQRSAENILAEIGTDMSQFETDRHIASWAGMCPGNHLSAGRSTHGTTNKGNRWLRRALTQAAWAASRAKKSYLSAMFKRLIKHRGAQRTIVAVGHSILISIYHMLKEHAEYRDLGPDYYLKNGKAVERTLVKNLERLGYKVTLEKAA